MSEGFPTVDPNGVLVRWAPLIVEPVPDGPERLVCAIAAVSDTGETGYRAVLDRRRLRTLFGDAAVALAAVMDTAAASLRNHLAAIGARQGRRRVPDFGKWTSPLQGVYLGDSTDVYVSAFRDAFPRAVEVCSVLGRSLAEPVGVDTPEPRPWGTPVDDVLRKLEPRLSNALNAQVRLSTTEHAITFTFYGMSLAANVVVLSPSRMAATLREARAHLWNLSLVADAPDLLIKPRRLELLTGVTEDSPRTRSAIEELAFEARGRAVNVSRVESAEDAARQIIAKAA